MSRWSAMAPWLVDGPALTAAAAVLALALVASSGWCAAGALPRPRRASGRPVSASVSPAGHDASGSSGSGGSRPPCGASVPWPWPSPRSSCPW